jgi:hypothetical protein
MVKVYWLLLWEEWLLDTVWSFSVGPVATKDAIVARVAVEKNASFCDKNDRGGVHVLIEQWVKGL